MPNRSGTWNQTSIPGGPSTWPTGWTGACDAPSPDRAARDTLRAWLRAHHERESEVWLLLSKKGSSDAAEEALCWGWIDSLIRRVDEETYMREFARRTNTAKWSEYDLKRVKALIAAGRMQPAGSAKVPDEVLRDGYVPYTRKDPAPVEAPEELARLLALDPAAKASFDAFPPSARKRYIGWIMSARREETRIARAREAMPLIAKGQKNLMK